MPGEVGFGGVGICLFIYFPGFPHLFIRDGGLARKLQARRWAWERGKSIGSKGVWALFKNHFQQGGLGEGTLAI